MVHVLFVLCGACFLLVLELAGRKSALNHMVVYSTGRSKAAVPVLVLPFVALWLFYEAICCMSCLMLFCSCILQSYYHCDYLAWGRES